MLSSILNLHWGHSASSTVSRFPYFSSYSLSVFIVSSLAASSLVLAICSCDSLSKSAWCFSFSFYTFSAVCFQYSTSCFIFCSISSNFWRHDEYSLNIASIFCRSLSLFLSCSVRCQIWVSLSFNASPLFLSDSFRSSSIYFWDSSSRL